jgi:hypothetical protein
VALAALAAVSSLAALVETLTSTPRQQVAMKLSVGPLISGLALQNMEGQCACQAGAVPPALGVQCCLLLVMEMKLLVALWRSRVALARRRRVAGFRLFLRTTLARAVPLCWPLAIAVLLRVEM